MSEVANIYDNGPISPVARIKDNLSIWSETLWQHFQIRFIDPIPRSTPLTAEMVTLSGATQLAANGTISKIQIPFLLMNSNELLHLRWEPIDDVEGLLWEMPGQARFETRGAHARVSRFTRLYDPYLATTTFYILGPNKDMNLEVRNPNPVIVPSARFAFFGFRYVLEPLRAPPPNTTYLPAQGVSGTPV